MRSLDSAGVPVDVRGADYSATELAAASDTLVARASAMVRDRGISASERLRVSVVTPLPDASGLEVTVVGPAQEAKELPELQDVAVRTQITSAPSPVTAASRWTDVPRFYGGAQFHEGWTNCTTGFAIGKGVHGGGSGLEMLTAAHCVDVGDWAYTSQGRTVGLAVDSYPISDVAVIHSYDGAGGYVYQGAATLQLGQLSGWGFSVVCSGYAGGPCYDAVHFADIRTIEKHWVPVTKGYGAPAW